MVSIKAYVFESEQKAIDFIAEIDTVKGYPIADGSTITYCNYEESDGVIFIRHTDFIEEFIGFPPVEIEIKQDFFLNS